MQKVLLKKYTFLKEILIAWSKINYKNTNEKISHEILWHNSQLKDSSNKTFFYKDWYNKGIMYIHHMYDYRTKNVYSFK